MTQPTKAKSHLTPYQLVNVWQPSDWTEGGGYNYIGQVVSLPFPTDTDGIGPRAIMVRRVPGHPGTIEQHPVDRITLPSSRRMTHVEYAVVRSGMRRRRGPDEFYNFPADMLRYDSCAPMNFRLEPSQTGSGCNAIIDPSFGFDEPIVAKIGPAYGARWTEARWKSFLWRIEGLAILPLDEPSKAINEAVKKGMNRERL